MNPYGYDWHDKDVQLYIEYRKASFNLALNPTGSGLNAIVMKAYADYIIEEAILDGTKRRHL